MKHWHEWADEGDSGKYAIAVARLEGAKSIKEVADVMDGIRQALIDRRMKSED